jgi:hypothetical protein
MLKDLIGVRPLCFCPGRLAGDWEFGRAALEPGAAAAVPYIALDV